MYRHTDGGEDAFRFRFSRWTPSPCHSPPLEGRRPYPDCITCCRNVRSHPSVSMLRVPRVELATILPPFSLLLLDTGCACDVHEEEEKACGWGVPCLIDGDTPAPAHPPVCSVAAPPRGCSSIRILHSDFESFVNPIHVVMLAPGPPPGPWPLSPPLSLPVDVSCILR